MTCGRAQPTTEVIAQVVSAHPDVIDALESVHTAAWDAVDARLLELCRIRAAQLIGCDDEAREVVAGRNVERHDQERLSRWYETDSGFSDTERAVLGWCEQFVIDVASMGPEHTEPVRAALGDAGLVDLTTAMLVVEQRQRLRVMWTRLGLVKEMTS